MASDRPLVIVTRKLPDVVETPGGAVFPALVDEGKRVGIRAFMSAEEAAESHRGGGAPDCDGGA